MKVIEILKICENFLKILQDECINVDDARYISLYEEYKAIVGNGGKTTYAVTMLSNKYNISERKVYYLIRSFDRDCKIIADG